MSLFDKNEPNTKIPSRKRPLSEQAVTKAQAKNSDLPAEAWDLVVDQLQAKATITQTVKAYDKQASAYNRHGLFGNNLTGAHANTPAIHNNNKPKSGN